MTELKNVRKRLTILCLAFLICGLIISTSLYYFRASLFVSLQFELTDKIIFSLIVLAFALLANIISRRRKKAFAKMDSIEERCNKIYSSYFFQSGSLLLSLITSCSFFFLMSQAGFVPAVFIIVLMVQMFPSNRFLTKELQLSKEEEKGFYL